MASSAKAMGLDQIPKSLLPLLACRAPLALGLIEITAIVTIFLIGEIVLSQLLYNLHVRDRPYRENPHLCRGWISLTCPGPRPRSALWPARATLSWWRR